MRPAKQPPDTVSFRGFKGTTVRPVAHAIEGQDGSKVPVIDCCSASSSSTQERLTLAGEIKEALLQYNCFYATNFGLTDDLSARVLESLDKFFNLPLEEKMRVHNGKSIARRGYQYFLEEKGGKENKDMREAFKMVADPQDAECSFVGNKAVFSDSAGNLWPEQPEDFRPNLYQYQRVMHRFSTGLMRLLALALSAPEDYFVDKISGFPGTSALYYPPAEQREDVYGRDIHTDYSWITLIDQINRVGGLDVLLPSGQWTRISPIPGTVVVVAGDFLERVSNDSIPSTAHRVVNDPEQKRYSMAFFLDADPNASIEVLRTCVSEARPRKYPDIKASDWQKELLFRPTSLSHPLEPNQRGKHADATV